MNYMTSEHVVAFIDVLGATAKIKSDVDGSLNVIHKAYDQALESLHILFSSETVAAFKPKVNVFSDNIIVAVPTEPGKRFAAFTSAAIFSALIQLHFLRNGHLVRGGISIGSFFSDTVMVWGEALVDAYTLENSVAVYPRIIVHPKTVAMLGLGNDERKQNWICQDTDDLFYIDYMQPKVLYPKELFPSLVMWALEECEGLMAEANDNIKVLQKIGWHARYLSEKLLSLPKPQAEEAIKQNL